MVNSVNFIGIIEQISDQFIPWRLINFIFAVKCDFLPEWEKIYVLI